MYESFSMSLIKNLLEVCQGSLSLEGLLGQGQLLSCSCPRLGGIPYLEALCFIKILSFLAGREAND